MNLSASKVLSAAVVTGALVCTMVATAFAAELSSGVGTVTASALKLRAEASTTSACLTLLPKGTSVVVEDDSIAGWYKVNHEGVTGYLSSEYVSFSISGSAKLGNGKVTGNDVNVRSAASTSASRLGSLNKGDVVAVTGIDNGWYKISFNGKTGYVRSDYMTITKEALSSRGTEAAAASAASSKGSEIVAYAKQYLGVKYVYAGASSKGFDCSGYTMYVMKHFGYNLPHTATGQMGYGTSVAKSALQPGDLVFFCDPSRSGGKAASHVGIYIGSNQFIHASSGGGKVQIDSLSKAYYAKYYVGARRLAN
ncbi:NlpC/P60 family protein [bacterium 210917-DFI.7.65]|nr:C40 family peptidase [Clostridiales bacterium]MCB6899100.1 NlpC/P60 family protein [bacterium 210917-DFI.7.65]